MSLLGRRAVWIPALVVWLGFGVALFTWLLVGAVQHAGSALSGFTPVRTGATAPADLPADLPVYPGAQVTVAFRGGATARTRGVIYVTPDSESQVYDFYRAAFRQPPWRLLAAVQYPVRTMSVIHEGQPKFSSSVTIQRMQDGRTEAIVEWIPAR